MSSAPSSSTPRPFVQAGDELNDFLPSFWRRQVDAAEKEIPDYRHPALPLARIKKVMKNDPEVKQMIAADAPILFCKACEIFISEITSRAFIQADSCKRRTLSQQDIVRALTKSDQFDFLIDIVPREEPLGQAGDAAPSKKKSAQQQASAAAAAAATARGTEADNGETFDQAPPAAAPQSGISMHALDSSRDLSRPGTSGGPGNVPAAMMLDQLQSLLQQPGVTGPGGLSNHAAHAHSLASRGHGQPAQR